MRTRALTRHLENMLKMYGRQVEQSENETARAYARAKVSEYSARLRRHKLCLGVA